MIDEIDFNKFKGKIVAEMKVSKNWRETEYDSITVYFTDGTSLDISATGENEYLSIYD